LGEYRYSYHLPRRRQKFVLQDATTAEEQLAETVKEELEQVFETTQEEAYDRRRRRGE
jgi:hypothetical protein